jgi:hypothetical protein
MGILPFVEKMADRLLDLCIEGDTCDPPPTAWILVRIYSHSDCTCLSQPGRICVSVVNFHCLPPRNVFFFSALDYGNGAAADFLRKIFSASTDSSSRGQPHCECYLCWVVFILS